MQAPLEALGCTRCQLWVCRTNVVWGVGPGGPCPIVLVGEAPGYNEDNSGKPFVGASGRLLNRLLSEAGIQRSDVYITNRVKCRPPQNRDPLPLERQACKPWLDYELQEALPRVVVLLGRHAATVAFPGAVMHEIRQTVRVMPVGDQASMFVATYHPAAALRDPSLEPVIVEDLTWVRKLVNI